jgi:hypothetical protein
MARKRVKIKRVYLDWSFDEDLEYRYKFHLLKTDHDFQPLDKVELRVVGREKDWKGTATILECLDDGIIIQAQDWVDISEEYSIELID